jgi:hypothetical protein
MESLRSISFHPRSAGLMVLAAFLVPRLALGQWQARAGSQLPDGLAGHEGDDKLASG